MGNEVHTPAARDHSSDADRLSQLSHSLPHFQSISGELDPEGARHLIREIHSYIESHVKTGDLKSTYHQDLTSIFGNSSLVADACSLYEESTGVSLEQLVRSGTPPSNGSRTSLTPEDWEAIMSDHEKREEYYRTQVIPVVEKVARKIWIGKEPWDKLVQDLLVSAHDILAEADPSVRDPLIHLDHILPLRINDQWREGTSRRAYSAKKFIERAQEELYRDSGRLYPPDSPEVLERAGLTQENFLRSQRALSVQKPIEFSTLTSRDDSEDGFDQLLGESDGRRVVHETLRENLEVFRYIVAELPERDRVIFELRFVDGLTQKEIGKMFQITESRVNQIEKEGLSVLRTHWSSDDLELFTGVPRPKELPIEIQTHSVDTALKATARTSADQHSAGYLRLVRAIKRGEDVSPDAETLSEYVDGAAFFTRLFSRDAQHTIERYRKAIYRDGKGLDFENMTSEAKAAFTQHIESSYPGGKKLCRREGVARAVGLDPDSPVPVLRKRLERICENGPAAALSGFERLVQDLSEGTALAPTTEAIVPYIDGPDFFRSFLSREGKLLQPFRAALFENDNGINFKILPNQAVRAFRAYADSLNFETTLASRNSGFVQALGFLEASPSRLLIKCRMAELGITKSETHISAGFAALVRDVQSGKEIEARTESLNRYIDGPEFFKSFFSKQILAIREFRDNLYQHDRGVNFSKLDQPARDAFKLYLGTINLHGRAADLPRTLVAALGINSPSLSASQVRQAIQTLGFGESSEPS